jgi:hypothetical protein
LRTHMLIGLAIASLVSGVGLTLAGLHPEIDSPRLSRLGLLVVLVSIPLWNAVMLRRARHLSDDQLNDTFQAGYRLHAQHVEQAAGPGRSRWTLRGDDTTERHGQ